jgi:hypothetical protein
MKSQVNFGESGEPTEIKVKDGAHEVGRARMKNHTAHITTVYPLPGHDGINVDMVTEMVKHLEQLPFVKDAYFNYKP